MKTKILFLAAIILVGCSQNQPTNNVISADSTNKAEQEQAKTDWTYTFKDNKMTNGKTKYATCISSNSFEFAFPYEGGSYLSLIVRNMDGKNEVMIEISKGQFMPSYNYDEKVRIKFDENPATVINYISPSDGSMNLVFLNNTDKIIENLKTSKKLMVECTFFNEGSKVYEFNTDGFKWD